MAAQEVDSHPDQHLADTFPTSGVATAAAAPDDASHADAFPALWPDAEVPEWPLIEEATPDDIRDRRIHDRQLIGALFNVAPDSAEVMDGVVVLSTKDWKLGAMVRHVAQRIHSTVYLHDRIIGLNNLDGNGAYRDSAEARAVRFIARNGRKVATARVISCEKGDLLSLPTTEHFQVNPDELAAVAHVENVADIKPEQVVEISGLASEKVEGPKDKEHGPFDAVIAVYTAMIAHSAELGQTVWVMNVEQRLIDRLDLLIGTDANGQSLIHRLGDQQAYMGAPTIPVALSPQDVMRALLTAPEGTIPAYSGNHLRASLKGIDGRNLPPDIRQLLHEQGVEFNEPSRWQRGLERFKKHPIETVVALGATALTAVRAWPASQIPGFGGEAAVLWGIDIATLAPYLWGIHYAHQGRSLLVRALGTVAAVAGFAAPYGYFLVEQTKEYPWYVKPAIASFVGWAVLKEVARLDKRIFLENALARPKPALAHL